MSYLWNPIAWDDDNFKFNAAYRFAFYNGKLMAAGVGFNFGPVVASSSDGVTFTGESSYFDYWSATDVVHADWLNLWVVVATDFSETVMTSPGNGVWTVRPTPWTNNSWGNNVAKSESQQLLVLVSENHNWSTLILTSPDGVNWTERNCPWDSGPSLGGISDVAYSPILDKWCAVGSNNTGDIVMESSDGFTWTTVPTSITGAAKGVEWSDEDNCFYISGSFDDTGTPYVVLTTSDLISFTGIEVPPFDPLVVSQGAKGQMLFHAVDAGNAASVSIVVGQTNIGTPVVVDRVDASSSWSVDRVAGGALRGAGGIYVSSWARSFAAVDGVNDIAIVSSNMVPVFFGNDTTNRTNWRFFVADLDGFGITDYSKLASDRQIEVVLNGPLSMTGTVPSDNPQVWIPYDGDGYDDPYLYEGTRIMWGFRRESDVPPYYVVRAATIVQLLEDEAQQDDARTRFQAWDPWHYMFSRPVCLLDGSLPGIDGISFSNTQASVVIATLLRNTIANHGFAFIDGGDGSRIGEGVQYQDWGGSLEYEGTLETGAGMEIDINFAQGTSVGEAWQQVADMGVCDIVLNPIYVPTGRTDSSALRYNYLVELNVYAQAGSIKDEQIFAWNMPGRSLVGLTRQFDGQARANQIKFFAGQGGSAPDGQNVPVQTDYDSLLKYGQYWAQQFFPGARVKEEVLGLAQQALSLRSAGRETVTVKPAPERSPRPWQDYQLGDRVPVWASQEKFRDLLGESNVGTFVETQYQRIYGWTANLSDDALETIDPLLTSPETGA